MATTLALAMRASMSAAGVTAGAQQAASALDKVGNAAKKTARDVSVLKTIEIGKLIGSGVSQLANAFTDAARSAVSYAKSVANAIDATQDLANRTGIGVEALQSLQVAAKLGGVDDITVAFDKLTVAIGKAGESGDTGAFERLGLNFEQLRSMSPEEQFRAIAAAISALPGEAERAAAAVAIFGKSGAQLVPFLSNLGAIEERAKKLGIVLSEQQVGNIAGMNDALDLVSKTFDGIIGQVVGNLAPAITAIAEQFLQFVESFNGTGGTGLADAITGALFDGAEQLASVFDSFSAGFSEWLASMGGFEGALASTGEIFSVVANTFVAVAESFRFLVNIMEMAGNTIALGLGKAIENLAWLFGNDQAQEFGKGMAEAAYAQLEKNKGEADSALANAGAAAGRVVFGSEGGAAGTGPAGTAVAGAREAYNNRNSPEAQLERETREAKKKADREAASAARIEEQKTQDMAKQHDKTIAEAKKKADDEAKAAQKKAEEDAKADEAIQKAASGQAAAFQKLTQSASDFGAAGEAAAQEYRDELIRLTSQLDAGMINETTFNENADKLKDKFKATADKLKEDMKAKEGATKSNESMDKAVANASEFKGENAALLGTKSKEALQANDVRSSEGISQFMALATGRDDPALVEYRKQTSTLMQLLAEQRAQRVENATILGGAAA
jgi:hypothetical protein